jgi:AAA domain
MDALAPDPHANAELEAAYLGGGLDTLRTAYDVAVQEGRLPALDPAPSDGELLSAYGPDGDDEPPVEDWSAEYVAPDVLSDAEIELHLLELEGRIPDSMLRALRYTQAREYSRLCHREFLRGSGIFPAGGSGDGIGRTAEELREETPPEVAWLVPGVLAPGWSSLLAGREKIAGKGTLAAYLVGCGERAEDSCFGPTRRFRTLVVTEEPPESIREKLDAFDIQDAVIVFGWELSVGSADLRGRVQGSRGTDRKDAIWSVRVEKIVREAKAREVDVVFCDNVSRLAGVEDEAGVELGRRIEVLADACRREGLALLADVHHRKSGGRVEDAARGSTSLTGAVDIIVHIVRKRSDSRVRHLTALGRVHGANWTAAVELAEDGSSYSRALFAEAGGEDATDWSDVPTREERALDIVQEEGETTAARVAEVLGVGLRSAQRYLEVLEHGGAVERIAGGRSEGRKRPDTFRVHAEDDPSDKEES